MSIFRCMLTQSLINRLLVPIYLQAQAVQTIMYEAKRKKNRSRKRKEKRKKRNLNVH